MFKNSELNKENAFYEIVNSRSSFDTPELFDIAHTLENLTGIKMLYVFPKGIIIEEPERKIYTDDFTFEVPEDYFLVCSNQWKKPKEARESQVPPQASEPLQFSEKALKMLEEIKFADKLKLRKSPNLLKIFGNQRYERILRFSMAFALGEDRIERDNVRMAYNFWKRCVSSYMKMFLSEDILFDRAIEYLVKAFDRGSWEESIIVHMKRNFSLTTGVTRKLIDVCTQLGLVKLFRNRDTNKLYFRLIKPLKYINQEAIIREYLWATQ